MAIDTDEEMRSNIRRIINGRPYYICKAPDNHTDLQSQFGSMNGRYSREHDAANEKYLEDAFVRFIKSNHSNTQELTRTPGDDDWEEKKDIKPIKETK